MQSLGTSYRSGPLYVWDPNGPTVYWMSTNSEAEGNYRAVFGSSGCISIRNKRNHVFLYSYDSQMPLFRVVVPFQASIAIICENSNTVLIASEEGKLGIWDLLNGQLIGIVQLHTRSVTALQVQGPLLLSASIDGVFSLWSLPDIIDTLFSGGIASPIASGDTGLPVITAMLDAQSSAIDPVVYTLSADKTLSAWALMERQQRDGFALERVMTVSFDSMPTSMSISNDGQRALVGTETGLWSVALSSIVSQDLSPSVAPQNASERGSAVASDKSSVLSQTKHLVFSCADIRVTGVTSICSGNPTNVVFCGLQSGDLLALFPGGGILPVKGKDKSPIESLNFIVPGLQRNVALHSSSRRCLFKCALSRGTSELSYKHAKEILAKLLSDTSRFKEDSTSVPAKAPYTIEFGAAHKLPTTELSSLGFVRLKVPLLETAHPTLRNDLSCGSTLASGPFVTMDLLAADAVRMGPSAARPSSQPVELPKVHVGGETGDTFLQDLVRENAELRQRLSALENDFVGNVCD